MNTLSVETLIHAPFPVTPYGGADAGAQPMLADDSVNIEDAWEALKWLGGLQARHSNVLEQSKIGQQIGKAMYWVTTGSNSSSDFQIVGIDGWANFHFFNRSMSIGIAGVGGIAKITQAHPTNSLVALPMALEAKSAEGWQRLTASIDRWAALPEDWDGDDGIAPPRRCVFTARRWINIFASANLPHPSGYVAGDGEIGFRWRTDKGFASVSLLEDGTELAFCRVGQSTAPFRMEAEPGKLDLYQFIESIAQIA